MFSRKRRRLRFAFEELYRPSTVRPKVIDDFESSWRKELGTRVSSLQAREIRERPAPSPPGQNLYDRRLATSSSPQVLRRSVGSRRPRPRPSPSSRASFVSFLDPNWFTLRVTSESGRGHVRSEPSPADRSIQHVLARSASSLLAYCALSSGDVIRTRLCTARVCRLLRARIPMPSARGTRGQPLAAIKVSCDVYFYALGPSSGSRARADSRTLRIREATGLDLAH